MKKVIFFLMMGLWHHFTAQAAQLIVFANPQTDQYFLDACLPKLKTFAQAEQLELIEKPLSNGLPADITSTPAIIFQNEKGRSVYAGRYEEFSTLINFIRTANIRPQPKATLQKQQVWVNQEGRMKVAIQTKVTAIQGVAVDEKLTQALQTALAEGLAQGLNKYTFQAAVALERTDRIFYLDIYPYLDETGTLSISTAIFSQFSCITPIATSEQAYQSSMKASEIMFSKIGAQAQEWISEALTDSKIGDAYTAIQKDIPVAASWEQVGLKLPVASKSDKVRTKLFEGAFPNRWEYAGGIDENTPSLQFQFLAPLDRYSGEFKKMEGNMELKEGILADVAFEVQVKSLTMGMESLDKKVLKSYLFSKKYPASTFQLTSIEKHDPLEWGIATPVAMQGVLNMMNISKQVPVQAILTPIVAEGGQARILVQASFKVNITQDFQIKGPDGPKEASENISLYLNFLMKPTKYTDH